MKNYGEIDNLLYELGKQKGQFLLSMESLLDDPVKTIESFNLQFKLERPFRSIRVSHPERLFDLFWLHLSPTGVFDYILHALVRTEFCGVVPSARLVGCVSNAGSNSK